jgi:glycerol dehydrogenase-like iron-containing ADH family enzyme
MRRWFPAQIVLALLVALLAHGSALATSRRSIVVVKAPAAQSEQQRTRLAGVVAQLRGVRPAGPEVQRPRLEIVDDFLADILRRESTATTLIVLGPHHAGLVEPLLREGLPAGRVVVVRDNRVETVASVVRRVRRGKFERVLGIGGGVAVDVARAAALDGAELVAMPSCGNACLSTNVAVLRTPEGEGKFFTQVQNRTIFPIGLHMSDLALVRKNLLQGAAGDFLAQISAAMDIAAKNAEWDEPALRRVADEAVEFLHWVDAQAWSSLAWLLREGEVEEERALVERLAQGIHDANLVSIERQTIDDRGGGEHGIWFDLAARLEHYRSGSPAAQGRPIHGQVVAPGTLLTARIFAGRAGQAEFYHQMRRVFRKLGLPTTRRQLEAAGFTRDDLLAAWTATVNRKPASNLAWYVRTGNAESAPEIDTGRMAKLFDAVFPPPRRR